MLRLDKIPDWLKQAHLKSALNVRDLAGLFGVSRSTIGFHVRKGDFPTPDFLAGKNGKACICPISQIHCPSREWYVSTVLSYLKQHGAI